MNGAPGTARRPTSDAWPRRSRCRREDVVLALNARSRVRSLSEPIGGEGDLRLMDVLGAEPMRDIDSRLTLAKLLRDLPDDERTLIVRRYFKSHTQTEIARDMGISQVQVSRLESRITEKNAPARGRRVRSVPARRAGAQSRSFRWT